MSPNYSGETDSAAGRFLAAHSLSSNIAGINALPDSDSV